MLDLSNPDKLPLRDMPEDVAVGMFTAWRNGETREYWSGCVWCYLSNSYWFPGTIYRIPPPPAKQLIAPWEWLAPWIKAVVLGRTGRIWGFSGVPVQGDNSWLVYGLHRAEELSGVLIFDTAGIDWRDSLTLRPEGK